MNVTAVLSMLHEPAERNSATRPFRGRSVLSWTLDRVARCRRVGGGVAIVCWEDQLGAVMPAAGDVHVLAKGPRVRLPEVEAVTAARRWADGWRGGLLSTCEFDRGFFGPWVREAADGLGGEAALLVDPASGLVDPGLLDALVDRAAEHPDLELVFAPAAPGLAGVLIRRALLDRLAAARTHPGRLLHYLPDQLSREPLSGDGCAPVPTSVARTTHRFTLDSDRQVRKISAATLPLNGQLIASGAEELVRRVHGAAGAADDLPREVVLELNTDRATNPIYWPGRHANIARRELDLATARSLFEQLAAADDVRLTIAGVGDPLLARQFVEIVDAAATAGIGAIHVETDLLGIDAASAASLAQSPIDVLSVHVPALTAATYEATMGVGGYTAVLQNISAFVTARQSAKGRVPILVPTFMKLAANLGEMEAWYDQWLRAVGSAVVRGPSDCGGLVPPAGVADMAPPRRRPCARLWSRLTVLSDGRFVSCEEDVLGRQTLGHAGHDAVGDVWQRAMQPLRRQHADGDLAAAPTCVACKEWHRP